jgi:ATP-binding cassette, subfamily C, bacterial LapB
MDNEKVSLKPNPDKTQKNEATTKEGFMDQLLDCLIILTHINEHPFSPNALTAGLPLVKNRLTPQLFVRAAQRAGFASRIVQRPLAKISKLVLPAILILKDNRACILNKLNEDQNFVEIITPDSGGGVAKIAVSELQESYTGYAIFVKPLLGFDKRADEYQIATPKSWFWGTLWHYRGVYGQVVLATFLLNIFALASPLFIMNVYNRVVPNFAVETLWVLASGICIVILFDFIMRILRGYLIDIAGKKADTILASTLFQQVMNVRLEAKPASSGAFANNLHQFEVLRDFFTSATVSTLVDLPFLFIFVIVMFVVGGAIGYVPLIAIPLVLLVAFFLEVPIRRAVEKSIFAATQKHALLIETVNNLETIKGASAEGSLQRKWEQYVGIAAHAGLKSRLFATVAVNFTSFIAQLLAVIIVIVGVYLIADNQLTLGGLIACSILEGRIIAPLAQVAGLLGRYNQSKVALQGLNKVMELPVERPADKKFIHRPSFQNSIEFHNVSFKYPNQGRLALQGLNLKINAGERVGIIGRMGSGKTTVEKLLLNFYSPTEGAIFIDGIDAAQIDPADLRRNIGYVSQDYSLLYGTVYENISLSTPWAGDQMVLQAAKLAGVDMFIKQHPLGFLMPIGEQGLGLSGGQRQAVVIARALLTDPAILLLDEPTSAIDNDTEQVLVHNLLKYARNKTLIIITHKPSMLTLVNRLVVMDNGQIVADGPKEEILKKFQDNQIKVAH